MWSCALRLVVCAGVYGATLGIAHSPLYALRNTIKFPLLISSTSLVCALAYVVVARSCGARLSGSEIQRLALTLFQDLSLLLAGLAPVNTFLAFAMRRSETGPVGEYQVFLLLNVVFVALAGSIALLRRGAPTLHAAGLDKSRSRACLLCWLALSSAVGGQVAFLSRPLFGLPITRDLPAPPFFLGSTPDVRGATNFYAMVVLALRDPPLPEAWLRGVESTRLRR